MNLRPQILCGVAVTAMIMVCMAWAVSYAADPTLDALAGNSGWVGAGLLGAVLAWLLLRHLPAKDAQLERMLEQNRSDRREQNAEFQTALAAVITHCEHSDTHLMRQMEVTNGLLATVGEKLQVLTQTLRDGAAVRR